MRVNKKGDLASIILYNGLKKSDSKNSSFVSQMI